MSTYKGLAAVILDNGRELPVTADLSNGPAGLRTSWVGTLSTPQQSAPIELYNLQDGTLRIDGHEGAFVRPDISDWMADPTDPFRMVIEGSGDAPF